jgi:acetoin utilization deacetylase AcuC-like enzyme
MLQLFYSPLYTGAIDDEARFPKTRYREVRGELDARGLDDRIEVRRPRPARFDEITLAHDPDYVRAFLDGTLDDDMVRRIGFRPWTEDFVDRTLEITGGTIEALEAILDGAPCAGNLAGGTHHAFSGRGGGYCVFNDLAIAARLALEAGIGKVLVLDLDVHQGDGTAAIFADEPRVFTYSQHCERNYPFRKQSSDRDVALPEGCDDEAYLAALERELPRVFSDVRPDLVFLQAGVDPLAEDRLGRMEMTREGLRLRNRLVFDYVSYWDLPLLLTMGGGYAEPIERSAEAHADLFEEAARRIAARPRRERDRRSH